MSAHTLAAAMLAGRHVLERTNPGLLAWTRRQWNDWLRAERNGHTGTVAPTATIVASLSTLHDLDLHVAVMQLLRIRWLRCTLVLSLPTQELTRIVRAQSR